jgi:hypothetical protein
MTARDIVNHTIISNKRLKGFEDISDFGVDVLVDMMNKYAKSMCDRQREICDQAFTDYNWTTDRDPYCVINAPYPEELI